MWSGETLRAATVAPELMCSVRRCRLFRPEGRFSYSELGRRPELEEAIGGLEEGMHGAGATLLEVAAEWP